MQPATKALTSNAAALSHTHYRVTQIVAALNDARAKGDKLMAEKMGAVTAGLPIPPGMKLF